jgi:apolipoprotein N-acyltransferase
MVGADLLVNIDPPAPNGGIYKTSVLIGPTGSLGAHQKVRLVPFGEFFPLRPLLGWVTTVSRAAAEDRRRGSGHVVLHAGSLAVAIDQLRGLVPGPATARGPPRRPAHRLLKFDLATTKV